VDGALSQGLGQTIRSRLCLVPHWSITMYKEGKAEALEHLDFAIGQLREMKMQPALERALKQRENLKV